MRRLGVGAGRAAAASPEVLAAQVCVREEGVRSRVSQSESWQEFAWERTCWLEEWFSVLVASVLGPCGHPGVLF